MDQEPYYQRGVAWGPNGGFIGRLARNGHLKAMKWASQQPGHISYMGPWVCIHAASKGKLEALKWAYEKAGQVAAGYEEMEETAGAGAATAGHLHVIRAIPSARRARKNSL